MSIKSDKWIRRMAREHGMIEPFEPELVREGRRAADNFCRLKRSRRRRNKPIENHEHKITRMLGERPERSRGQNRSIG